MTASRARQLCSSATAWPTMCRPEQAAGLVQAMLPFSKEELDYIARLDVEVDCRLLRRELPWLREAALRTLTISTLVLQVHCGTTSCRRHPVAVRQCCISAA